MMTINKQINFPGGEVLVLSASYENNIEPVVAKASGPVEMFLEITREKALRSLSGPDFSGCYNSILEKAGCSVVETMTGEWEMFTE